MSSCPLWEMSRGRRRVGVLAVLATLHVQQLASGNLVASGCEVGTQGACALVGDPHIWSFDRPFGPPSDALRPGVYQLVKSSTVSIQGLFSFTHKFPSAASLTGLAVTGAAVSHHKLVVQYQGPAQWQDGFKVTWDGQEILLGYPAEFSSPDGTLLAKKSAIDPASVHQAGGTLPSFEFHLGEDLYVTLLVGPDFANVLIKTKKSADQDGLCGNFNCNPEDDTLQGVQARGSGSPISGAEVLFTNVASLDMHSAVAPPEVSQCDEQLKTSARTICQGAGADDLVNACIYDACASGSVEVAKVIEAVLRIFSDEVKKIHAPAQASTTAGHAQESTTAGHALLPSPSMAPTTSKAPDMHVHVKCPCANAAHLGGHCPCAAAAHCPCMQNHAPGAPCPCAQAMAQHGGDMHIHTGCPCAAGHTGKPCPCMQAHMNHCPCMHNHSAAHPCPCAQAAMTHCPCMQAAMHCPCAHPIPPLPPATTPAPSPPTTTPAAGGPMMKCDLNCFEHGAEAVMLPGASGNGDDLGVSGLNLESCRDYCMQASDCEAVVFGGDKCFGKKNVITSKCQPGEGRYSTEILRNMPKAVCGLFGDPHIVTFDAPSGDTIDQFAAGEYVLVRSSELRINGRFGYSERFASEASTVGLSVTGALINNHKLVVQYYGPAKGYKGFKVFWDGKEILADFPSTFKSEDGVLTAEHGDMDPDAEHPRVRHTIGGAPGSGDMPSYRFSFLPDWKIYILLGEQIMNAVIEVHQQVGGVDGYCGNFNCNAADDTFAALTQRGLSGSVPETESMFAGAPAAPAFEMTRNSKPFSLMDCDAKLKADAEAKCASMPEENQRTSCVYDACASGKLSQAQEDVQVSTMEEHVAVNIGELAEKFFGGLLGLAGPTLPWQVFAGMALFALFSLVGCGMLGRASRGSYQRVGAVHESLGRVASASGADRLIGSLARRVQSAEPYYSDEVSGEHTALVPNELARSFVLRSARYAEGGDGTSDEEQQLLA